MAEEATKLPRIRRSKEERIAEIEKKIEEHKRKIAALETANDGKIAKQREAIELLETKKYNLENNIRAPRKRSLKRVLSDSGLKDEEVARRLGFESVEQLMEKLGTEEIQEPEGSGEDPEKPKEESEGQLDIELQEEPD